jgi:hypothetical protein
MIKVQLCLIKNHEMEKHKRVEALKFSGDGL